jgi:hypothetical protein
MTEQKERPEMDTGESGGEADLEWFQSSDDVRTGVISGVTFPPKQVEYSVVNGKAMFEGDIVLFTPEQLGDVGARDLADFLEADETVTAQDVAHGLGIYGQRFRWPRGIIPFEIEPSLPNQQRVTDAIAHIQSRTRLRLVQRTAANQAQYPNFVRFVSRDGCWSWVGMRGGMQEISLGDGCGFGAAVHEILHAAGLWHEQSREDRNNFVTVHWENIQAGRAHNFNQHITDGDDIGNYDFDSLMHYGRFAFSSNNQPTITTVGGQAIGQRNGMSAGDIAAIRALYPHLEPSQSWRGVQFRATVPANSTRRWFTHSWPHHWYVLWTVVPTAPAEDGPAQIKWKIRVEKQEETLLKYYVEIRNMRPYSVAIEARYEVLGWSPHTF